MSGASGEIRRWQRRGEIGRGGGGGRGGNSVGAGSFKKKKKIKARSLSPITTTFITPCTTTEFLSIVPSSIINFSITLHINNTDATRTISSVIPCIDSTS